MANVITNVSSALSPCLEPVCGGGRFWTSQAGERGEESGQNILSGAACEGATVRAPQA